MVGFSIDILRRGEGRGGEDRYLVNFMTEDKKSKKF